MSVVLPKSKSVGADKQPVAVEEDSPHGISVANAVKEDFFGF